MKEQNRILDDKSLDVLFRDARTYNGWKPEAVSEVLLQAVYDLMKWGPTSANCCPARFVFVKSKEAKEKLRPHLLPGNVAKTMAAPFTAVVANDLDFYRHLPRLFPHDSAKSWFEGNDALIRETAMRNGSLQGAYFMIAARALGLDCGPMSGFSQQGVKDAFFPDGNVQVNFLCNIGYGEAASLFSRSPRFSFDEVCKIV
jgi:3-hydroxypropanoate dehydrogenase